MVLYERKPDYPTIKRFCKYLCFPGAVEKEVFTWSFLTDVGGAIPGFGVLDATLSDLESKVREVASLFPGQLFTIHTTLNRTKLNGRKDSGAIESVRVLCVDLDREIELETARKIKVEFLPGLVVRSSPGKYHFYWKIDSTVDLATWGKCQLGLAWFFREHGADKGLRHITSSIRVPGMERVCKNGELFTPAIVHESETVAVLDVERVQEIFPDIFDGALKAEKELKAEYRELRKQAKKNIGGDAGQFRFQVTGEGRNTALYFLLRDFCRENGVEIRYEVLNAEAFRLNGGFSIALDEREVLGILRKVWAKHERWCERRKKELAVLDAPLDASKISNEILKEKNMSVEIYKDKHRPSPPKSIKDAANKLAECLFENHREELVGIFNAGLEYKIHKKFAEVLGEKLKYVGAVRATGLTVSVEQHTSWGAKYYGPKRVNKDEFIAFSEQVIYQLCVWALRDKQIGRAHV